MIRTVLKNRYQLILQVLIMIIALSMVGCKKKESTPPLPLPPRNTALDPNPVLKPIQKPVSSSVPLPYAAVNRFDFSAKKDPFKPFIVLKAAPTVAAEGLKKPALPIHSYDVSQFRLIGVVMGAKENHAMVVDPTGKGYVLKSGMTIGKNNGQVKSITSDSVEILEQFKDDGKVRKERIKITLPRKQ